MLHESSFSRLPLVDALYAWSRGETCPASGSGPLFMTLNLVRNVADQPFPRTMSPAQGGKFLARWETGLRASHACPEEFDARAPAQASTLQAWHDLELPAPLPPPSFTRLLKAREGRSLVLLNRDDHFRYWSPARDVQDLAKEYRSARSFFEEMEKRTSFARHPDWGCLCADPSFLGTGLRLQAILALPQLQTSKNGLVVQSLLEGRLLRLLPWSPPGLAGQSQDHPWMVLESASTLGICEEEQLLELAESVKLLLHYESSLLSGSDPEKEDRAWRAWGILSQARKLGGRELHRLVADLAWGLVHAGMDVADLHMCGLLLMLGSDPVVQVLSEAWKTAESPIYLDHTRSELVRLALDKGRGR